MKPITHTCRWPDCTRSFWGITEELAIQWAAGAGWVRLSPGWLCPTHARFVPVIKDLIELIP